MGGRPTPPKTFFGKSELGVLGVPGVPKEPMRLFLNLGSIWRGHPWERRCSVGVLDVLGL